MNHTIQLTAEQFQALQSGQPITIEPPKPTITKWEPMGGKFLISGSLDSSYPIENKHNEYSASGLRYQTKTQAENAAKAIRAYARQLAWLSENDDGWVADWSKDQDKYYVTYSHEKAKFETTFCFQSNHLSTIFMSEANATKLARLMNDGIVSLEF
jgi:hypothetical protein